MVKDTIQNGQNGSKNFLFKTQNTIISAAFVIAVTYGISAVLALVRARLLAHFFGISDDLAVFYTADKIPGFIYSVLVVGTLSTVFIPIFASELRDNEKIAWKTASSMITVSMVFFTFLSCIVFIFSPQIIDLLAIHKFTAEQVILGSNLMRIMLVAQLVLVVSSFITSILQSFKYFIIPAIAPVFYNVGMIVGIVFLFPKFGIYGAAAGVLIGAILHLLVQIPLMKKINFNFSLTLDLKDKGLKEIFSLMPSRIFGTSVIQISDVINNSLAILISTSSVIFFKFASQLQSFPVNLFGASIALAALPTLSFESLEADREKFKKTFLTSFHQMLFLVIPASVILLVLRVPAVRLVYGASKFPWDATILTSYTLGFFSLSIFAQSATYLLTRSFFALKDTITPVKVNLATIAVGASLALFFIRVMHFGVWSIALAGSISTILDMFLMLALLSKKVGGFGKRALMLPFFKIGVSAIFMGLSLYIPMKLLDIYVLDTTKTINLIILTIVVSIAGFFSYVIFTSLFKVDEVQLLYKLLKKMNLSIPILTRISDKVIE